MPDRYASALDPDASGGTEPDPSRTGRVVVGADVSAQGSAALLWAMRHARRHDGHVMVLDSRPRDGAPGADAAEAMRKAQRWQVQAWVSEVLMGVGARVPVLVSSTEGRLELALAGAGSRADLVVFGGDEDGPAPLDPAVLLRFCPCPVVRVDQHQQAAWLGADR